MLYYRNKSFFKKQLTNIVKGMAVIGVAVWFGAYWVSAVSVLQDKPVGVVYDEPLGPFEQFDEEPAEDTGVSFTEPAVGVLTSPFGQRWGRMHEGIDIGGDNGSDILAAESGMVEYSGWVNGYGNYIRIVHQEGYKTAYAHMGEIFVKEGDFVQKGDRIATMGSTGNSTGPHLHFEIISDGECLNPLEFVIY